MKAAAEEAPREGEEEAGAESDAAAGAVSVPVPAPLQELAKEEVAFLLGQQEAAGACLNEEETDEGIAALRAAHAREQREEEPHRHLAAALP